MSDLYTAKELKERISKNDNRCTASPYLLLLREKTEVVVHEDFYYNGQKWVEHLTGDYLTNEKREALMSDLLEYGYDKSEIEKKGSIEEYFYREVNETRNVFLTDEGYKDHLEANGHNLRKHDTFGIHAFRNKEIASLLSLIDANIEQEEKIKNLEKGHEYLNLALSQSAEKIDSLESQKAKLIQEKKEMRIEIESVRRENKKLREALKHYAHDIDGTAGLEIVSHVGQKDYIEEFGTLARKTPREIDGRKE